MSLIVKRQFVSVPPLTPEQKDAVFTLLSQIKSWEDFCIFVHCDLPECGCETWQYCDERYDSGGDGNLVDLIRKGLTAKFRGVCISRGQILTAIDELFGYTPRTPRYDYDDAE